MMRTARARDTAMIIVLAFPFALLWPGALIAMQM
jgi:hypothetical protein